MNNIIFFLKNKMMSRIFLPSMVLFISYNALCSNVSVDILPGVEFQIGERWSKSVISKNLNAPVTSENIILSQFDDFPLLSWMRYIINNKSYVKELSLSISKQCQHYHNGDVMMTVSCIANTVKELITKRGVPSSDFIPFTYCRANATLFRASFENLNLPRSNVFDISSSAENNPHVVSRFILTSKSGQTYSYVIDVGNKPHIIYPNTKITEEWYKSNVNHPIFEL